MKIVMSVSNLVQRDLLSDALRMLGNSVTPKPCLADVKDYIRVLGMNRAPDLVVLQDDGKCNAFALARSIQASGVKTVVVVLVKDYGRANYPDVVTVKNHGTAEEVAEKIMAKYDKDSETDPAGLLTSLP